MHTYEKYNDLVNVIENGKSIAMYSLQEVEQMILDHQNQINYIQTLINEKQAMIEVLNGNN